LHPVSSSEFLVQKIDPSDDGFVFQVINNNNILYYYVFKHDRFVFCPAFLCGLFELTDYSCHVVKNVIDYYYIILEPEPLDQFSLISDCILKLFQRYNFIPPSDEKQISHLRLESSKKIS
jgi:hypothetical protein